MVGLGHTAGEEKCAEQVASRCSVGGLGVSDDAAPASILVWARVSGSMMRNLEMDLFDAVLSMQVSTGVGLEAVRQALDGVPETVDVRLLNENRVPVQTGLFDHDADSKLCPGCGKVFYKIVGVDAWALVLKLSSGDFCYGSSLWTDGSGYNADKMLNLALPVVGEYDAKSVAFHLLTGVTGIVVETTGGLDIINNFASAATPELLMTSNRVKLQSYPEFSRWFTGFGAGNASLAPMFVRAGEPQIDPDPPCRDRMVEIQGCGMECTFCYMAGEGSGCPLTPKGNDLPLGLGINGSACGINTTSCSSYGVGGGPTPALVWAKVPGYWLAAISKLTH
eukprot:TRINITY_DN23702_c0_g1_i4.p2 TRINITY_DN23702_c0_g1~~TRINITY_DN23702_c0_g1_i4.p2  ORF type:complete len:336 (+),score=58.85 TRINITY_DN23702_c0_g1_i4:1153-2160(+)